MLESASARNCSRLFVRGVNGMDLGIGKQLYGPSLRNYKTAQVGTECLQELALERSGRHQGCWYTGNTIGFTQAQRRAQCLWTKHHVIEGVQIHSVARSGMSIKPGRRLQPPSLPLLAPMLLHLLLRSGC